VIVKTTTKRVTEFGATVTLYRVYDKNAPQRSSLWHSDPAKAVLALERLANARGWA